jgi:hypothetical protein
MEMMMTPASEKIRDPVEVRDNHYRFFSPYPYPYTKRHQVNAGAEIGECFAGAAEVALSAFSQ